MKEKNVNENWKIFMNRWLLFFSLLILFSSYVFSTPDNVTITYVSNTTKYLSNGSIVNYTGSNTIAGGYIFTINVNGTSQNNKWKAFVGNVTGSLTLDDASGNTIYDWALTDVSGEIYSTRTSGTVNWSNINCSYTNTTEQESWIMNHTNGDDNISATFDGTDNAAFSVGTIQIPAASCPTTNVYINSTQDATDQFEEVILYDGGPTWFFNVSNTTGFQNIVYAQVLEPDIAGFNQQNYDFQILLPEKGYDGWTSSTAYYFYVELS